MTEIRLVWQSLQRMMPKTMSRPSELNKRVRLMDPRKLTASKNGYRYEISGDVWVKLSSKNPPQVINVIIETTGLELTSEVDINLNDLVKHRRKEETVKAFLLASLINLGIFSNPFKRKAFEDLTLGDK